jgi:tRNA G18 (ribose-2'-O)-methylase SpoU
VAATLVAVSDPADPRLAAYASVRERDLVARHTFLAEGVVVLRVLVARAAQEPEAWAVRSVLLGEGREAAVAPELEALPPEVPAYVLSQHHMNELVGFPIHRGVLAEGVRLRAPTPEALSLRAGPRAPVVVLVGLSNHDNVGGIFRSAAALGAAGVLLDAGTCDPLYRKALRVSVGGCLAVPYARLPTLAGGALAAWLRERDLEPLALSPGGKSELSALAPPPRAALVLGAEGPGLEPSVLTACRTVRIAMAPGFDSLNVSVTAGIALHHLTRW